MSGIFVAIFIGGIWMVSSALILTSVCISASRFNRDSCPAVISENLASQKRTLRAKETQTSPVEIASLRSQ